MSAETIITVRYAQGTYLARVKGQKKTASCVYSPEIAAEALARKLGIDPAKLVMTKGEVDCLEFTFSQEAA